ncbi:MAG: SAM-dependent DNA methyltransferase [Oscillospiraceae bacterium]|nr:SAM-dependent DNA methyltransferase [Oscillospiraceae bacterium]
MSKLPRIVRGERQKELVRVFDAACGAHNRWEVWSDAMVMYAVAISNAVDKSHYERREEIYRNLSKKYTEREMDCIVRMFALIVESMEENPDQDFLGDLYMALELGNQKNGQFFTPYSVCAMMAKMQPDIREKIEQNGWIAVNDPACGAGALLVAFANECRRRDINYQQSVLFVAQDIDFVTGCMCYVQLSLLGCPGYVVVGDTIANPATSIDGRALIPTPGENVWYTPMYFEETWHLRRQWFLAGDFIRRAAAQVASCPKQEETAEQEVLQVNDTGQMMLF